MSGFEVSSAEANFWWRKNVPAGALLNNLMFLFVVAPIALVIKHFYALSFVVFALMVPYGFLVRRLAVRAVRNHIAAHPESIDEFQQDGVISFK